MFGLALIAGVWVAALGFIRLESEGLRRQGERDAANYSLVLQQDVAETVSAIDRTLKFLVWIERHDDYHPDWAAVLAEDRRIDDESVQTAVIDAKGLMLSSSLSPHPTRRIDISDRPHFLAQMRSTKDELYVGPVVRGRVSDQITVQFSRKRVDVSGNFLGVVVVSLPGDHFDRRFETLDLGEGGGLVLVGDDGLVRAGSGIYKRAVGGVLSAANKRSEGDFVSERRIEGEPLRVIARLPDIEFDPHWRFRRMSYLIAATLISLATLAATLDVAVRRARYEEEILNLSRFDPLTQLHNRLSLSRRLAALVDPSAPGGRFALHIIDLDRFKTVNDTYGHATGDELLKVVADRLRELAGPKDLIARLGGDEFAVLQPLTDYETEAGARAQRICEALARPIATERANLSVGATVGIACGGRDALEAAELMKAADLALYAAKTGGRGAYGFYSPAMAAVAHSRMRIETGLRSALAKNEFYLDYQPIVSTANDEILGFEALLRWRRPDGEMIGPADFIPVAEDLGLIREIGAWTLRRATAEIAELPGTPSVAVNCSPAQFGGADLIEVVQCALAAAGLPASQLRLEITESMLMRDRERILEQLNALRALGVGVSIDDFGTGYSCLSYLEIYPIDTLKIDRQFVRNIGERPAALDTLRAIVDLASSFGMKTVAEGVETREQLMELRKLGCDGAQGFLVGRPGPLDRFVSHRASLQPAA